MVEKLIHSLRHPDSQTSLRAVWLLGKLKVPQAVTPLISLFEETKDIYLAKAVVMALSKIGGSEALNFLKNQATHPVKMIRDIIKTILGNIDSNMLKKQNFKSGGKL
jgi:HEAT repeat protein